MATPRTGRPRGRPKRGLRGDPDRYALALMLAHDIKLERAGGSVSARKLATVYSAVFHGELLGERQGNGDTEPHIWVFRDNRTRGATAPFEVKASALRRKMKATLSREDAVWLAAATLAITLVTTSSKSSVALLGPVIARWLDEDELAMRLEMFIRERFAEPSWAGLTIAESGLALAPLLDRYPECAELLSRIPPK